MYMLIKYVYQICYKMFLLISDHQVALMNKIKLNQMASVPVVVLSSYTLLVMSSSGLVRCRFAEPTS